MCSFCAIVVRSTVDIVVQSGRRVYAWESKLTARFAMHVRERQNPHELIDKNLA